MQLFSLGFRIKQEEQLTLPRCVSLFAHYCLYLSSWPFEVGSLHTLSPPLDFSRTRMRPPEVPYRSLMFFSLLYFNSFFSVSFRIVSSAVFSCFLVFYSATSNVLLIPNHAFLIPDIVVFISRSSVWARLHFSCLDVTFWTFGLSLCCPCLLILISVSAMGQFRCFGFSPHYRSYLPYLNTS